MDEPEDVRVPIAAFDRVIARYEGAADADGEYELARTLANKGTALRDLDEQVGALACYDLVLDRFGSASVLRMRELIAYVLFNRADVFRHLGQLEAAQASLDQLVSRFQTEDAAEARLGIARVLRKAAETNRKKGAFAESLMYANTSIGLAEMGSGDETTVAGALFIKAFDLFETGLDREAMETCDQVVQRFGGSVQEELQARVAAVLILKTGRLVMDRRFEDGLRVTRDLLHRYGASTAEKVRVEVSLGLMQQAVALASLGRRDEAAATFRRAETEYSDALPDRARDGAVTTVRHFGVPTERS